MAIDFNDEIYTQLDAEEFAEHVASIGGDPVTLEDGVEFWDAGVGGCYRVLRQRDNEFRYYTDC